MAYYDIPIKLGSFLSPKNAANNWDQLFRWIPLRVEVGSVEDCPDESVVSFPYTEDWSGSKQGRTTFPKMKTCPLKKALVWKGHFMFQASIFKGYVSFWGSILGKKHLFFFRGLQVKWGIGSNRTDVGFHFRMLQGYNHTWWWRVISFACLRFCSKAIRQNPATLLMAEIPNNHLGWSKTL